MRDKLIVVFDTNIFLQALGGKSTSPAARCLDYFEQRKIVIGISHDTLEEIEEVLSRTRIRQKHPLLTDEKINDFLDRLVYRGIYVRQVRQYFAYPRDPDDEPYINLAIEVAADYLVSRDNDLLDLMKWDQETSREFQKRFRTLRIVTPEEFLRVMEQSVP